MAWTTLRDGDPDEAAVNSVAPTTTVLAVDGGAESSKPERAVHDAGTVTLSV